MEKETYIDKYEVYEELFAPKWADRGALRQRKRNPRHVPKRTQEQIIAELAEDPAELELGFAPSYQPSRYECGWLLDSLHPFYDQGIITDVLTLIKGGKEASVYCCAAHPSTGLGLVAAKVYRPRMFRNLRNDKMYRQGREVLTPDGRPMGRQAERVGHAIEKKTSFGLQAAHTSWLMHEYVALEQLSAAGAAVPRPIAAGENAVLMSYHGDEDMAAPTLNTMRLDREEAERLFHRVIYNVDLMLQHNLVHGDLSAYNVLYWKPEDAEAEITLIDFPQVVNLHSNDRARYIFERDIAHICEYFAEQGVECDSAVIADGLWRWYVEQTDPDDLAADVSRLALAYAQPDDDQVRLGMVSLGGWDRPETMMEEKKW